ncbi:MAG: MBL fold metallo-hydrolase [Gemmatimonadetes bacterium]|nr:MBL fold metallo-hydrolase [Gemmatimonadota bacterium]
MPRSDTTIDVRHLGRTESVAVQLLDTEAGPVLVDTGPGSTLETLRAELATLGLAVRDLHAVLLTHIHFDHAGATGLLVDEHPGLTVYVHERGARHLADPAKLVASATRIYGDRMEALWGRILPVPAERIHALAGGESLRFGARQFDVRYTPGHAVHHVSYFEPAEGTAYVGDTGGIHLPVARVTLPVCPPPDFDLEAWLASLDAIAAWAPRRLFSTHYGFSDDPARHLADLRAGLLDWTATARALMNEPLDDAARANRFAAHVRDAMTGRADPDAISVVAAFSDFRASFHGIARYWTRTLGG